MGLLDDDGPPPQGDPMEMLRLLLTKGAPPMSDADFASLFTPPSLLATLRRLPGYGASGVGAPSFGASGYGASGYGAPFGMTPPGATGAPPPFATTPSWPWAAASPVPGASAPEPPPPEARPRGLLDPDPGRGLLGVTLDEPPPRLPTYAELFDAARRGVPYGLPDGSGAYAPGAAASEALSSGAAPRGLGLLDINPRDLGQPSPPPAWRALSPDHAPWVRRLGGLLGVFPEGDVAQDATALGAAVPSSTASDTALDVFPEHAHYNQEDIDRQREGAGDESDQPSENQLAHESSAQTLAATVKGQSNNDETYDSHRGLGGARLYTDDTPAPPMLSPVPDPKIRLTDAYGSGHYRADREDRGLRRPHWGVDLVAAPGTTVTSPITGTVVRGFNVYERDNRFQGIELRAADGHIIRLMYVRRTGNIPDNSQIIAGQALGSVQDLSSRYPGITNHVHLQVERYVDRHGSKQGGFKDPTLSIKGLIPDYDP